MEKKQLVVYAGSFNPFHIGHKNIADKLADIFGKENILIAVGVNPSKHRGKTDLKNITEKTGYKTDSYGCYLHQYLLALQKEEGKDIVLARGLRNSDDLAYETRQLKYIKELSGVNFNTIFIQCDEEFNHISSSAIRDMNTFEAGSGDRYLI